MFSTLVFLLPMKSRFSPHKRLDDPQTLWYDVKCNRQTFQ